MNGILRHSEEKKKYESFNIMAEYCLLKLNLPVELIDIILDYLPTTNFRKDIKKKRYLIETGFCFKRLIVPIALEIPRSNISYFDWYNIFHHKDYSVLIKYENKLVAELLKMKSKEEIEEIHLNNLRNCSKRNFMNYKVRF